MSRRSPANRAGHPRKRRRPQRRDGRHACHQRPHRDPRHAEPGNTFLDRMIAMVEGARRQKTPNEIALTILLSGLTIVFLLVVHHAARFRGLQRKSRRPDRASAAHAAGAGRFAGLPDSDDDRRTAERHRDQRHGSLDSAQRAGDEWPRSRSRGRHRRAAARQDRHHHAGQPHGHGVHAGAGISPEQLADAAQLASLADETPEGRSIVVLAKEQFKLRGRDVAELNAHFIPFTAQTRMSGVDFPP